MTNKILRCELLLLFFLTLNALIVFYLSSAVPDNIFSISSGTNDFSYISYYTFSLLTFVYYFTGPWIIASFVLFSFFYIVIFSKRDQKWDSLLLMPILLGSMLLLYAVSPGSIGTGLNYYLQLLFPQYLAALIGLITVGLLFYLNFKNSQFKMPVNALAVLKKPTLLKSSLWDKWTANFKIPSFDLKAFGQNLFKRKNPLEVPRTEILEDEIEDHESEEDLGEESEDSIDDSADLVDSDEEDDMADAEEEEKDEEPEMAEREEAQIVSKPVEKNIKAPKKVAFDDKKYMQIVSTMSHKKGSSVNTNPSDKYFSEIIERIEDKLTEFKIDAKIINILKGPVVDTFELEMGAGVKVSKVTASAEDLSLALYGAPIRIVYPMKGRTTIGIEVPRNPREIIFLDEIFNSKEYKNSNNTLPIAMGKDAFGEVFVVDLAAMPHMLIAGATGAGKSVFLNTLLVSLLAKKSPRQMKLILIDPKQLELALYANLPHLVVPVITDSKTATLSLMWACQEMERRYSILKEFGVRNIDGFNQKLKRADDKLIGRISPHYEFAEKDFELPYLVIIIDEFADLILTKAGKEIENNICRLAAKARAAGIHLVIATQRPSVDVITGLIKSNFPTRVSFRVTTSVDSRTILNATGAEKLLGKGDMLYKHGVETLRVHSAYVDEEEIEMMTMKLADLPVDYDDKALEFIENEGNPEDDPYAFGSNLPSYTGSNEGKDDLFEEAVKVVMEHRAASASMLQRRLKIGYNRAANLIDELEAKGVVGPAQGAKPRKVMSSSEA
jgi:DNA segregation ATPase FtsK/SpoIIIE, S-DNA-T family